MKQGLNLPFVIIGAGPAGLMAAEILSAAGHPVAVYDRMPSPARKFLMAGRGGLNLTHSEPLPDFLSRYRDAQPWLAPLLQDFTPADLRAWCEGLGQETFVGSSGRVFPKTFKASPLLRAWIARLVGSGVSFHYNQRWTGLDDRRHPVFNAGIAVPARGVLLAMGGASWPRLGSDGGWVQILRDASVAVRDFTPSNCGFTVDWPEMFRQKYAGAPVKPLALSFGGQRQRGEAMVTAHGLEGGAVYALSGPMRDAVARDGSAVVYLDLHPDLSPEALEKRLSVPRRRLSLSNFLRKNAGLSPVAAALVQVCAPGTADLVRTIKSLPLTVTGTAGLDRAISSAGGLTREMLDDRLMIRALPGVFAAGEMIDWEAPTGGYLLQACFSTAVRAAKGMIEYDHGND